MDVTRRMSAACLAAAASLCLSACGSVDPAETGPVTELANAPEGFSPTEDSTRLPFGEAAQVVTTNFATGMPAYWDVTVHAPTTLTVKDVAAYLGRDPQKIDDAPAEPIKRFTCFRITFTQRGTGLGDGDAPTSVELPRLTPVDAAGANANYVGVGAGHYCGIDPDREVPAFTGDMREGEEYETAVVTWEGVRDPGVVGTEVQLETVLSPRNPGQPPQNITWAKSAPARD